MVGYAKQHHQVSSSWAEVVVFLEWNGHERQARTGALGLITTLGGRGCPCLVGVPGPLVPDCGPKPPMLGAGGMKCCPEVGGLGRPCAT